MRSARTHDLGSVVSWRLGIFSVAWRPPEVDSESSWKQAAAGLCPGLVCPSARRTAVTVECRNTSSLAAALSCHRLIIRFQLLVWKQHLTLSHLTLQHPSYLPLGCCYLTRLFLRKHSPLTRRINFGRSLSRIALPLSGIFRKPTYLIRLTPSPIPLFPPTEHTRDGQ